MKKLATVGVSISALLLSGCASVTGSPNQSVSVQTRMPTGKDVVGSACELSNNKGKWFVTTPGSVSIHRSNDDLQVVCMKEGMDPGRAAVVSETKGSMFGNIILGGGIGAIIDHNNGSAYEYPSLIQIVMGVFSKLEIPKPSDPSANLDTQALPASQVLTKEQRLKELNSLYEKGLISKDIHAERQRAIVAVD